MKEKKKRVVLNYLVRGGDKDEWIIDRWEDAEILLDEVGISVVQADRQTFFPMDRINWVRLEG